MMFAEKVGEPLPLDQTTGGGLDWDRESEEGTVLAESQPHPQLPVSVPEQAPGLRWKRGQREQWRDDDGGGRIALCGKPSQQSLAGEAWGKSPLLVFFRIGVGKPLETQTQQRAKDW